MILKIGVQMIVFEDKKFFNFHWDIQIPNNE